MAHDIFISYSSVDGDTAATVCRSLEAGGLACWIAPRDIPAGTSYPTEIIQAIKTARVMVVLVSSHANLSPHVANEVERAVNGQVAVIPFRIENIEPSDELQYFLARRHWMDALSPPLEPHLERLAHAVRAILSAPPTTTGPQPQRAPVVVRGETLHADGGEDVHLELALTATEAAQGGKRYVTAAGRSVKIEVPPGVHDGAQSRYPGGGQPGKSGGEAGALVITFRVTSAAPAWQNQGHVPPVQQPTHFPTPGPQTVSQAGRGWIPILIIVGVIFGIVLLLGIIGILSKH